LKIDEKDFISGSNAVAQRIRARESGDCVSCGSTGIDAISNAIGKEPPTRRIDVQIERSGRSERAVRSIAGIESGFGSVVVPPTVVDLVEVGLSPDAMSARS
jgi:hypothetical protein